jgi:hypothetical protein
VTFYVTGRQFRDGRCERRITLSADDYSLTVSQVRELATELLRAADGGR